MKCVADDTRDKNLAKMNPTKIIQFQIKNCVEFEKIKNFKQLN